MCKRSRIISFLTDFGTKDAYVGEMKGVILGIYPYAKLVDISHKIEKHDILQGAFILLQVSSYFPKGSIHLAVVDPGVGTTRRRIIIQGRRSLYVGPDNGLLSLAAKNEGIVNIYEISNKKFMLPFPSKTFEGRDIFAPIAAYLAKGIDIREFGPTVNNLKILSMENPEKRGNELLGKVLYIDSFGNITTNIPLNILKKVAEGVSIKVTIESVSKISSYYDTYGILSKGATLLTLGSSGFLEIAINQGNARDFFKAKIGSRVVLTLLV